MTMDPKHLKFKPGDLVKLSSGMYKLTKNWGFGLVVEAPRDRPDIKLVYWTDSKKLIYCYIDNLEHLITNDPQTQIEVKLPSSRIDTKK